MSLIQYMCLYLLTLPIFVIGDLLWLGIIAKDFYKSRLAHLLGPVRWGAAVIFYFIFILGILIFAVVPALESGSILKASVLGSLFGLFTYATYDLTNLATLKNWSWSIVVVDIIWGSVLCGGVAVLSFLIGSALFF